MKIAGSKSKNDWATSQLQGKVAPPPGTGERRDRPDRRRRLWRTVWYGSINPRRRQPARRTADSRFHLIDWYSAHLLAVAISILLLSVVDAFLTLILLQGGADEVNPVMAAMLYKGAAVFTALKMALTGCSVLLLVLLSRYRFMRLVRVDALMYMVLAAYTTLIAYEIWMLNHPLNPHLL